MLNFDTNFIAICSNWQIIIIGSNTTEATKFNRRVHSAEQTARHYLNPRWPSLLTHICVNPPQWVTTRSTKFTATQICINKKYEVSQACPLARYPWVIIGNWLGALFVGYYFGRGRHKETHLTPLPLDKMAAILADDNFKSIFLTENNRIPISLTFVPRSPIINKPALVPVMAWRRTDDKPLPERMLTQFTDAYMRH